MYGERNELNVTWKIAIKLWWSFQWRSVVFIVPTMIALTYLESLIVDITNIATESWIIVGIDLVNMAVGTLLVIWVFKTILGLCYSDFRISIVECKAERNHIPFDFKEDDSKSNILGENEKQ